MAAFDEGDGLIRCSFCAKGQDQVSKIVAGPSAYICDECVELCRDIIAGDLGEGVGETGVKTGAAEGTRG